MLEVIQNLENVRERLNIPKSHFCAEVLHVPQSTYFKWLDNSWGETMHPSTLDHLERVLVELEKEARPLSEKLLDFLEVSFDHYTAGNSLIRPVTLFVLKKQLKIEDEDEIIDVIHKLVKDGNLRLLPFQTQKNLSVYDVIFELMIGTATRTGFEEPPVMPDCNLHTGVIDNVRLYRSQPLTEAERDPKEIRDVKAAIKELRAEIRASLDQRIVKPASGWTVEKEERRLDRIDETALRNATLRAGKKE